MKAVAAIVLVAARGPLAQQLGISSESIELGEPLETKKVHIDPVQPLTDLKLIFLTASAVLHRMGGNM